MTSQPNILVIIMDSVSAENLSCYGYHQVTTPHIDLLAQQSTLFEQAISVGCWTLPVHASLFTGLYPLSHGVTTSKDALPGEFPTLALRLEELGFQTACFSNNAYISETTGLTQGFDTVESVWSLSHSRGTKRTKMERLIKRLEQYGPRANPVIRLARTLQRARTLTKRLRNRRDKGAKLTNEKIQAWLTTRRNPNQPFFLFVNYMDCHLPYNPPYPYNRRFMPKHISPWHIARVGNNRDVIRRLSEERSLEDIQILRALYDGQLCYLDQQIGELVRYIDSLGILDDTVLIITSDHGDSLGEHNHIGHRMALYEQLVRVPLLIRYPARFQPGARVRQQVSLIDLYPTILELAGIDLSQENTNGFHSLITPLTAEARPFIIAENTAPKSQNDVIARMIRTGQHKYIWKSNQEHELYDLVKDPRESANLVDLETKLVRKMDEYLEEWKRSAVDHQIKTGQAEYDQLMLDVLRQLGYVE